MFYQKVLKPILFKFDPEDMHHLFIFLGEFFGKCWISRWLIGFFYRYKGKDISKKVDGITYKTPFILSAGFDCNGRLINILPEISFGGVEIGSVTARACRGNNKPRMIRLPKSQSILVNKGLRNDGVEAVIKRLKKFKPRHGFVVGVSIARTNDEKSSSMEAGIGDYFYSFRRLNEENIGDYYALNISCPSSFTGETFTNPELLDSLLLKISSIKCDKPIYVKMPISLEWPKFDGLLKVMEKFEMIKGVIIGNINKDYNSLDFREEAPKEYKGGLSGKPCFKISNRLIKQTKEAYGKRFTVIGCGGIMSPEDIIEKFKAGSDLVALITGIIYNGPGFVKEISDYYAKNKYE